MGTTAKLL